MTVFRAMTGGWKTAAMAVVLLLAGTAVPAAGQSRSCRECDSASVSQRAEVRRRLAQIEAARAELVKTLQELEPGSGNAERRREIRAALQRLERMTAELQRDTERVRIRRATSKPAPQVDGVVALEVASDGWLGITFTAPSLEVRRRREGTFVAHGDYPVIDAVEPGSPAARAGMAAGDVIVAYDGQDLRNRTVNLTELLRPGRELDVRFRRAGRERTVQLTVAERPRSRTPVPPRARVAPRPPEVVVVAPRDARHVAPMPARADTMVMMAPAIVGFEHAVAGADVVRLDEEWRDVLGVAREVRRGLVVVAVAHGSPAARAGLRKGDVVISANGTPVATPHDLRRALSASPGSSAELRLLRKGRERTVVMTWGR